MSLNSDEPALVIFIYICRLFVSNEFATVRASFTGNMKKEKDKKVRKSLRDFMNIKMGLRFV